ncbi:MAG: hypothetical protein WC470_03705 [Candidatus Paceibacterota bacterium]
MNKDYEEIEPPVYLFKKITSRIEKEERLLALKRRIFAFFAGLFGLIPALVYTLKLTQDNIAKSGFGEYFSLLFSDSAVLARYWYNFFSTLLESFPIVESIILLAIILIIMQISKYLARDFRSIKSLQAI